MDGEFMPMPLVHSVRCHNCGAPLNIPQAARFITCQHCQAELQVEQTSDVVYTQIIHEVAKRIDNTQTQLNQLVLQQRIDRLDYEWKIKCEEILGTDSPNPDFEWNNYWWCLPGAVFVLLQGVAVAYQNVTLGFLASVAVLNCLIGFGVGLVRVSRQNRYWDELGKYRSRRIRIEKGHASDDEEED
jgi:LSD1 subclass zinc finger protein